MPAKPKLNRQDRAQKKLAAKQAREERRRALVEEVARNPLGFHPYEDTGLILGFDKGPMTAMAGAGAPVAFRRMNPQMIRDWIRDNQEKLGKLATMAEQRAALREQEKQVRQQVKVGVKPAGNRAV